MAQERSFSYQWLSSVGSIYEYLFGFHSGRPISCTLHLVSHLPPLTLCLCLTCLGSQLSLVAYSICVCFLVVFFRVCVYQAMRIANPWASDKRVKYLIARGDKQKWEQKTIQNRNQGGNRTRNRSGSGRWELTWLFLYRCHLLTMMMIMMMMLSRRVNLLRPPGFTCSSLASFVSPLLLAASVLHFLLAFFMAKNQI